MKASDPSKQQEKEEEKDVEEAMSLMETKPPPHIYTSRDFSRLGLNWKQKIVFTFLTVFLLYMFKHIALDPLTKNKIPTSIVNEELFSSSSKLKEEQSIQIWDEIETKNNEEDISQGNNV